MLRGAFRAVALRGRHRHALSHSATLARLTHVRTNGPAAALSAVVFIHLAVSLVHGAAHAGAAVPLTPAAALFVLLVIEIGPLAGLAWARVRPREGGAIVAATMAGALVFGLANHFLVAGADHVSRVAGPWRALFGSTAVLLLVTEAAGVVVGLRRAMTPARRAS